MTSTAKALALELGSEKKKQRGTIQKGQKLPGAGRPMGSKNKVTLLKEAILQQAEEKVMQEFMTIVDTTIKLANSGDTTCLKILWDRVLPAKRAIDDDNGKTDKLNVTINISGMETKGVQDVQIIEGELADESS